MPAFARWDVGTLERGHVGRLEGWKVEIDHGRWRIGDGGRETGGCGA
jgi:hypothetical protein